MINQLLEKLDTFPMREKLGRVAYQLQKLSVREWKRQVHDTLGLNLLEDYYKKSFTGKCWRSGLQRMSA